MFNVKYSYTGLFFSLIYHCFVFSALKLDSDQSCFQPHAVLLSLFLCLQVAKKIINAAVKPGNQTNL